MRRRTQLLSFVVFIIIFLAPCQPFAKENDTLARTPSLQDDAQTKVLFDGKALFEVKMPVASFSPAQRAKAISERIESLAKDPLLRLDELKVIEVEEGALIVYGDRTIMTISTMDARVAGKTTAVSLAQEYAETIRNAIREERACYTPRGISSVFSLPS